jgi:hypothetical protein
MVSAQSLARGAGCETARDIRGLIDEYIALNRLEKFARIPHPRYINFMADFAGEKGASRESAIAAWKRLKDMNVPKTYDAWRKVAGKTRRS